MYSGVSDEENRLRRDKWLFPVWVFLAIFSKGPVGILVPLVSVIVFLAVQGQWRKIGTYWGWRTWGILIALCVLWFGAVYAEGGTAYLDNLLIKQTAGRAVDSFHHKAPVWYYAVSIWYSLAPWSLLVIGVLIWGLCRWRKMQPTALERLFLVVALSTFVVLSMVSSKIQIYLLPAFPFFIYAAVLWMARAGVERWMKWLVGVPAAVLALTLPGVFVAAPRVDFPLLESPFIPIAAAVITLASIGTLIGLWRDRIYTAITTLGAGLLVTIFTVSFAVPLFNGHLGMGDVCGAAKVVGDAAGIRQYYTYDISRAENIDVYLGQPVILLETPQAADSVQEGIVLTRKKLIGSDSTLTRLFSGHEVHRVGDYAFGVILKSDER